MQTPTHPNANQLRWPIVNAIHITNTVDWIGVDWIGLDWIGWLLVLLLFAACVGELRITL
jgi:hypothetical protein